MPSPDFIAQNSRFFESIQEHRFLFELARHLVTRKPPRLLNILRAEVDMFGFDLVLSVASTTRHLQMKTRSGVPPNTPYDIAETIWRLPGGCVAWMLYSQETLEPASYYLLGSPLPPLDRFPASDRRGFRKVKMQQANHIGIQIPEISRLLFDVAV
jgi:hypothetical protein